MRFSGPKATTTAITVFVCGALLAPEGTTGFVLPAARTSGSLSSSRGSHLIGRPFSILAPSYATNIDTAGNDVEDLEDNEEDTDRDDAAYQAFLKIETCRTFMAQHQPFQTLGKMEQEVFLQLLKERSVVEGEIIAQQGAKATDFFLVQEGTFDAFNDNGNTVLFTYDTGDMMGAIAYASNKPYQYSLRATSNATVWYLDTADLDQLVLARGGSKQAFQESLDSSLRASNDRSFAAYLDLTDKMELLIKSPIFQNLTSNDLEAVANKLTLRTCQMNEVLIQEGDSDDDTMYFVKSGEFQCYKERETSKSSYETILLKTCKKGDLFGELSVFFLQPRLASVRVKSPSSANSTTAEVWALSRDDLFAAAQESPLEDAALRVLRDAYQDKKKSLDEIYQLWVIKSRPKQKPVTRHSTFSGVASGFFLAALVTYFTPGKGKTLFFDMYSNLDPALGKVILLASWMMVTTGFLGYLRLQPRAPAPRRRIFETALFANLFLAVLASSNLNSHPTFCWFNGFSWLGKFALISTSLGMLASTLRCLDDVIAGPMKGRDTIAGMDTRAKGFLVTLFVYIIEVAMVAGVIPPLLTSNAATFLKKTKSLTKFGINGWLISVCFTGIAQGAFGSALSTFQFEKKITKRQGLFWAFVLLFTLNIDAVLFTLDGSMKGALNTAWFFEKIAQVKYFELSAAALGMTILNAFQKRITGRGILGFLQRS